MPALTTWSDDEAAEMMAAGSPHGAPPPPDGPADFLKEPHYAASHFSAPNVTLGASPLDGGGAWETEGTKMARETGPT